MKDTQELAVKTLATSWRQAGDKRGGNAWEQVGISSDWLK